METKQYNEILHYLKLESVYYSRSTFGGTSWAVNVPAYQNTSMFHVVVAGSCLVKVRNTLLELNSGDVLFLPRAHGHQVMGSELAKAVNLYSLPVKKVSELYETLDEDTDLENKVIMLCGAVKIAHPSGAMLINDMPDVVHIQKKRQLFNSMMEGIVDLIFQEAENDFLGGEAVITRLVDILMIQAIRQWILNSNEYQGKWLKALKDPKIGKALSYLHTYPERAWTIEQIGKEVGMSRTAFATRFSELVGDTPINYLTSWRMNLAELRLKNGEKVDLAFIESLGYQSESSFRRAFKKTKGYVLSDVVI
jgi:AraC-like DNA-binding protein